MKILHLLSYASMGGIENYTRDLFTHLEVLGHSNTLIVAGEVLAGLDVDGRRIETLPGLIDIRPGVGSALAAVVDKIIRDEQPDVALVHTAMNAAVGIRLTAFLPTAYFAHNYAAFCPSGALIYRRTGHICQLTETPNWRCVANAYLQGCNSRRPDRISHTYRRTQAAREWLGGAQAIVCDSEYVASRYAAAGYRREAIHVLPTAVNVMSAPATEDLSVRLDVGDQFILFAGRLVEDKGLGILLRSLPQIPAEWRLVVAGDGHDEARFRKATKRLNLQDRVRFVGRLGRDAVRQLMRSAAVVVVPSIWPEPFGMVGPEAMAEGRPVVASAIGGIGEWLQDGVTGLSARAGDPLDLAAKINRLLTDRDLAAKLGRGGRSLVHTRFRLERHVDEMIELLGNVILDFQRGETVG